MIAFRQFNAGRTRSGIPHHILEIHPGDGRMQYECFDYEDARQVLKGIAGTIEGWIELPSLEITAREYRRLKMIARVSDSERRAV